MLIGLVTMCFPKNSTRPKIRAGRALLPHKRLMLGAANLAAFTLAAAYLDRCVAGNQTGGGWLLVVAVFVGLGLTCLTIKTLIVGANYFHGRRQPLWIGAFACAAVVATMLGDVAQDCGYFSQPQVLPLENIGHLVQYWSAWVAVLLLGALVLMPMGSFFITLTGNNETASNHG